ncbi:MAG: DUF3781 domain-containing protein [Bacteroidia bacterium]|nr:DUF3781 domain-containing protein [Bacteroidia bacterium]
MKTNILNNICYTQLVYKRINKKLGTNYCEKQIEKLLYDAIEQTDEEFFEKIGKNFYISNRENKIRITINSNTFRVITVDKIKIPRLDDMELSPIVKSLMGSAKVPKDFDFDYKKFKIKRLEEKYYNH